MIIKKETGMEETLYLFFILCETILARIVITKER